MTTTQQILTTFTSKVDLEKEYTRGELAKMLTEVFKEIREGEKGEKGEKKTRKKAKKEGGEEKKKREPTLYNLFVKKTMGVVKEENPEMSRQDLMREVGRMWQEEGLLIVNKEGQRVREQCKNEAPVKEGEEDDAKEEDVKEKVEEVKKVGKKEKKGKKE